MITIIDYDAGNLKSVEKALISLGEEVIVSRDSSEILQADKVILPGARRRHGGSTLCQPTTAEVLRAGGCA